MPIVGIGPWLDCQVLGLMLLETERKDEFKRVGTFKAYSDVTKGIRRPVYPLGVKTGKHIVLKSEEKRGWFGRKKKADVNEWTERIFTII